MKTTPVSMYSATVNGILSLLAQNGTRRFLLVSLFAVWGAVMFIGGQRSLEMPSGANQAIASLKLELLHQQREVDRLLARNEETVNALAARLAELQAASTRVDALGERLVQMGQLTLEEFDFASPAPMGGPTEHGGIAAASENELRSAISALSQKLRRQSSHLDALRFLMVNRQMEDEMTPAGWPVTKGWISSRFGERNDPFTGERAQHLGLDFAGTRGTDVLSVASGVVIWSASRNGYGKTIEIEHANGYVTRYAHNDDLMVVAGERVAAGQVIAAMGSTGRASSPHVHFEVLRNGGRVNPASFVTQLR